MKLIAISDTHNKHNTLTIPECDVLIHAGDSTGRGRESEIRNFAKWFNAQPAIYKIFVPGNHELEFERQLPASKLWFEEECPTGIILINESITIAGLKIYGSPVTPWFHNLAWNAYTDQLKTTWAAIPQDTDVLVTHGPAATILDSVKPGAPALGCYILLDEIQNRVNPKIHIHGHIHGGHGKAIAGTTTHYNVSICDEAYGPCNPITEIIID